MIQSEDKFFYSTLFKCIDKNKNNKKKLQYMKKKLNVKINYKNLFYFIKLDPIES